MDTDRRIVLFSCLAVGALWIGGGCNLMEKREAKTETVKTETSTGSSLLMDELKVDNLAGAHAGGRSAGAWSSEAREIESHFNVR